MELLLLVSFSFVKRKHMHLCINLKLIIRTNLNIQISHFSLLFSMKNLIIELTFFFHQTLQFRLTHYAVIECFVCILESPRELLSALRYRRSRKIRPIDPHSGRIPVRTGRYLQCRCNNNRSRRQQLGQCKRKVINKIYTF